MNELLAPTEVERGRELLARVRDGLGRALLGQDELLDLTVVALAARGHVLLEGLPGLGKTELVKTLARLLDISFARLQFTPDLLPSDITGGPVLEERDGQRDFVFRKGPVFANLVLADEINRASPKTQSALLEAMQEQRVTVLGETHELPTPFLVLATQNPIELEGTYPLPEAQLDRFLFKAEVPPIGAETMEQILNTRRHGAPPALEAVLDHAELGEVFELVGRVFLPQPVASYIARLVEATHPKRATTCPEPARAFIRWGASPRAAIALAEAGRAAALADGRPNVDFSDVDRLAAAALGHRLVLDHAARLEGVAARDVVALVLNATDAVGDVLPRDLK